jgi:hypothetical protein
LYAPESVAVFVELNPLYKSTVSRSSPHRRQVADKPTSLLSDLQVLNQPIPFIGEPVKHNPQFIGQRVAVIYTPAETIALMQETVNNES